jgi:hypothetical protein
MIGLILFLVLAVFPARGQEAEGEDWVLPNRQAVRDQIRYGQALAPDLRTKMEVINRITDMARSGGVSAEDAGTLRVLRYLAGEGTLLRRANGGPSGGGFPEARRASCAALGYIGGKASREILLDVLAAETESLVLSQAVASLGKITDEPDDEVIRVFTLLLERKVLAGVGADSLTDALLGAIGKLADSQSGIHDERLFRTLIRVLDAPLGPSLRRKTMLLLEKLKGF